jgi:hypothetical protein
MRLLVGIFWQKNETKKQFNAGSATSNKVVGLVAHSFFFN